MQPFIMIAAVFKRSDSTADDAFLMVWNVETGEKMQEISCVFHGPVISICWIDVGKGDNLAFVFGCADGNLHLYHQSDTEVRFSLLHRALNVLV